MERCEQLWPNGPKFYWDSGCFPPSTDSFLLAAYPRLRRSMKVCDLGAGAGLLGVLLLSRRSDMTLTAVERDAHACEYLRRNAEENGFPMQALQCDLRTCHEVLPRQSFDLVITNPPYFAPNSGAVAEGIRGEARTESTASLTDILDAADTLLRYGGELCIVYRTDRLAQLMQEASNRHLTPKRLRLVHSTVDAAPSMALLICKKGGAHGLTAEPPLLIKLPDGSESPYVQAAYFREKEDKL
ncbi:MAG: methyltransferase [Oscillospiraceae bacterium]|nr:methyltransferase [Oscillospiraceae bacterium]